MSILTGDEFLEPGPRRGKPQGYPQERRSPQQRMAQLGQVRARSIKAYAARRRVTPPRAMTIDARVTVRLLCGYQRQRISSIAGLHGSNEHFGGANALRGTIAVVTVQCGKLWSGCLSARALRSLRAVASVRRRTAEAAES
jgi:hypothetical protein